MMPSRSVVSWSPMVGGYATRGCHSFPKRTAHFDSNMYANCASEGEPDEDKPNKDLASSTKKMSAYLDQGKLLDARELFDEMPFRDSVAYNIIIRDYVRSGRIVDARDVFDGMPGRNTISWNSMIMGYSSKRKMHVALKLFTVMPDNYKDTFSWTIILSGFARDHRIADSLKLFKQTPQSNPVIWASVISGFQQNGLAYEALMFFKEMLSRGTRPASHSVTSALAATADLSSLFTGQQLYSHALKRGLDSNTHVVNSTISMFMKSGSLDSARILFYHMPRWDLCTWNCMITGFGHHGLGAEAISTFNQMQKAGFRPDAISFFGVLQGCSHCGYVNQGQMYFGSMQSDFDIRREPGHYVCLVDILARAGLLREAVEVISDMPFEVTPVFWRAILNGCRIVGQLELGLCVATRVLEIEPDSAATCLMVMEMYKAAGRHTEGAVLREWMRRKRKVRKELGYSWVEITGKPHLFTTKDETHQESDSIYRVHKLLTDAMTSHAD
uniref:Pentatricopeptide repeat-containing protein At4g02750 n=1 Tax=Anthurium amnicola TaxID=1678845 RepID=A0A1D1ZBA8_9ARAE